MHNITKALSMVGLAAAFSACMLEGDRPDERAVDNALEQAGEPSLEDSSSELQDTRAASEEALVSPEDQEADLLAPCGESLQFCGTNTTCVNYRHCTSGSDSLRVRAIIGLGPDGPCTTVGPNETRGIWAYGGISFFDHIARC